MPELPEVETIARKLRRKIIGKSFQSIKILSTRSFSGNVDLVCGKEIKSLNRRGKLIIFEFEGGAFLVIHLKMTGQLIYDLKGKNEKIIGGHPDQAYDQKTPHQYTRVIFKINDGSKLYFNDLRLFGWIRVVNKTGLLKELSGLGLEPIENRTASLIQGLELKTKNHSLRLKDFRNLTIKYPRRRIKDFLQDQKLIAGIGNIYASEILFCAGVLPERRVGELAKAETKKIYGCISQILNRAIKFKGTSVSDYRQPDGSRGGYLDKAAVYQREGKECLRCQGLIQRKKIGQRSAFYCRKCQR